MYAHGNHRSRPLNRSMLSLSPCLTSGILLSIKRKIFALPLENLHRLLHNPASNEHGHSMPVPGLVQFDSGQASPGTPFLPAKLARLS